MHKNYKKCKIEIENNEKANEIHEKYLSLKRKFTSYNKQRIV